MAERIGGTHGSKRPSQNPNDGQTEIPVGPSQDVNKEIHPQRTGNRQTDHQTAAAQARQTFKTPHDMTYATPNSALVGKEHINANGTPILQTNDGQRYKGTLNDKGNITQWQPINENGKETGKPITVNAERTGLPPAGMKPEQYVSAPAPRQTDNNKSPEPLKADQSKFESAPKAETKNAFEAQKELYDTQKQNFDRQKQYLENAAQSLGIPTKTAEPSESKTTNVEHISVTPTRPEMERTSVPQDIHAQRIERTISAPPNTVEYGREYINNRDSRQLLKPSLEGAGLKPIEGLQIKPEPLSQFRPEIIKSFQDAKVGLVAPLQGLAEPFTFTPKNPINRTDIIDQLGDIGKGKNPFSIASLLPAILAVGRRPEARDQDQKIGQGKTSDSVNQGRLEPALKANLDRVQQTQKDKLVDIANKVKENKIDNLSAADDKIAKRVRQLEPKQIDLLIAWAQGRSPIKFDGLRQDFQTKLSSIFETIVKATQPVSTDKNNNLVPTDKSNTPKAVEPSIRAGDVGSQKPVLADRTILSDKTKPAETEKTVEVGKTKPLDETNTKAIKPNEPTLQDKTIPVKGTELSAESDKTVVQSDTQAADFEADEDTKPSAEEENDNFSTVDRFAKRKNRKTKQMQEQREVVHQQDEQQKLLATGTKTTLLSNTARRHEFGTLASGRYVVALETLVHGTWLKVLECTVNDDDVLFITYNLKGAASKQSIGVPSKIEELVQNNFFLNWQDRINKFLGIKK